METVKINRDFESMLISAERYAMGRRTYIVSDTVNYITSLLPNLSDWCILCMKYDIASELEVMHPIGNIDREAWEKLLEILKEEIKRRDV